MLNFLDKGIRPCGFGYLDNNYFHIEVANSFRLSQNR